MRRKAVSPVIATLLLIVIAVAAAVLTYIWVTGYMGTIAPRETPTQLKERIKIDAVSVTTGGIVKIYVSNIGDTDTQIVGGYVLTESYTAECGDGTTSITISPSSTINPGGTATVSISGCSLTSGETYIAKVSAKGGAEATYPFKAP